MLIVLTAEIAAGVWAYQNGSKLEAFVKLNFKHTIETEYGVIDSRTEMVDAIQDHFQCCGVDGPKDYSTSKLNNAKGSGFVDLAISAVKLSYSVPPSCCKNGTERQICDIKRKAVVTTSIDSVINKFVSSDRFLFPSTRIFTNFTFRVAWER
jgi:CD81 antigen